MTKESTQAKPPRKQIDWEAVEIQYRAGIRSLKDIGAEFGVSDAAIIKRAKRDSWARDLKAKILARADAKVSAAVVSAEVSARTKLNERETIERASDEIASVRLGQRKDIQRSRSIVMRLFDELELQAGPENASLLEELGELLRKEDDKGQDKLNDLYQKIISLPGRAKTMKDLGESLRVLVGLERQAFGMDDKDTSPADAFTKMLQAITGGGSSSFQPVARDPEHDED